MPADAGFFLVAWVLDLLTCQRAGEGLREAEERLEAIREEYGLSEDAPADADAPPQVPRGDGAARTTPGTRCTRRPWRSSANPRWPGSSGKTRNSSTNATRPAGSSSTGRWPKMDPDAWLDDLLDAVSACVEAQSPMGPLGLRYHEEDGFWDVTVHPTPVELVGGRHDGEVVAPDFTLDLEQLRAAFDAVVAFGWNALGLNDPEGPYVYVEGVFDGREVYLQVLAYAPEDEEPGLKLDATRRRRPPG